MNKTLVRFCISAVIAALYAAVSLALAPLSFGPIQIRIAEAMTLLPILFPEAIAGVTLGCFLTNLIGAILDDEQIVISTNQGEPLSGKPFWRRC